MNITINKLNHFPDTRYTAQHSVDSRYSEGTFNISTHHSHQPPTHHRVSGGGIGSGPGHFPHLFAFMERGG